MGCAKLLSDRLGFKGAYRVVRDPMKVADIYYCLPPPKLVIIRQGSPLPPTLQTKLISAPERMRSAAIIVTKQLPTELEKAGLWTTGFSALVQPTDIFTL